MSDKEIDLVVGFGEVGTTLLFILFQSHHVIGIVLSLWLSN
jgi:hypothetical protein